MRNTRAYESGVSWEELDRIGFKLRLAELERGAVNVVVQPGQWELPRVDHIGLALDEDDFAATLARADQLKLRVQEHGARGGRSSRPAPATGSRCTRRASGSTSCSATPTFSRSASCS